MKTFSRIGMTIMAIVMSMGFIACSDDDEKITSISIAEGETLDLMVNSTGTLHVKYEPSFVEAPNCIWSSDISGVLTINENTGEYTAKSVGKTVVTLTAPDLKLSARCAVTVNPIEVKDLTLNHSEVDMFIGDELELAVSFEPEDATFKEVVWSSSNEQVATVDEEGMVRAIKDGACVITVSTKDGKCKAECAVTVNPIEIEGITLSCTEKEIEKGETFLLNANITPENATYKDLIWTSSDTHIATVENGTVTGVNEGTCTITVTDAKKKVSAECTIKVNPISVKGIYIENAVITMMEGDSQKLYWRIQPSDAANQNVKFEIEDESIASISEDGVITGLKVGETKAKVTTIEGNYTAECRVNIVDITAMVSSYFGSSSTVNINGYVRGQIECYVQNNSSKDITLKSLQLIEGDTGYGRNVMSLNNSVVNAGDKIGYTITIKLDIYCPIFRWVYIYEGQEYTLDIQYR